jgi:hypothetical protein
MHDIQTGEKPTGCAGAGLSVIPLTVTPAEASASPARPPDTAAGRPFARMGGPITAPFCLLAFPGVAPRLSEASHACQADAARLCMA